MARQPWLSTALCSRTHFQVPPPPSAAPGPPDLQPAGTWGCCLVSHPESCVHPVPGCSCPEESVVSLCLWQLKEQSLVPGQGCKQQQSVAGHEGWLRSKQLGWVLCQTLYSLALHQPQPGDKAQGQAEPGAKGFVCSNAPNPAVPPPALPTRGERVCRHIALGTAWGKPGTSAKVSPSSLCVKTEMLQVSGVLEHISRQKC